ncbi:ABC-type multidrug transport system fused ATPase/permease subunit [Clostridium saccharobutylicum]|nr:ABC-type multidrug transport system fused ATPase/permease subunit [Clostridium saccharobutylicum]MBA8995418.1 ABC-type multidrug transport system fused ATPase/permease subunit [Clostridium saccharobutylicum]NOV65837.1 ABC-type multidrug transport system fused ATPase/permease subunit [Clostridium saccharobutylicum]NOV75726.1 ABC-type multidrug transport system fused ATPase/permease subunit [Clostridium saccharobutylicum]NOW26810.1 ABC-type multidrug transport system fused ATPase/permease subu
MIISDGEILESRNHESLMQKKGQDYKMIVSQMGKIN